MNKNRTLSLIEKRFTNIATLRPELIRAERRFGDTPFGVFYFDFSQAPSRDDFNLNDYLQQNLASDFYQHEGSLQWNYYLYFVLEKDAFKKLSEKGKTAEIEVDRTFARKFVKDEERLHEELQNPLESVIYNAPPPKDIVAEWTAQLEAAGLGAICDADIAYTQVVETFLSSEAPIKQTPPQSAVGATAAGAAIEWLKIKQFREYPSQKDFEFGDVNLFRGVNGAGKTSVLEAIELSLCGGVHRQDGDRPTGALFEVKFRGDSKERQLPLKGTDFYRSVDGGWYGAYYRNGNRLCHNFARFNFFDSDAGFRLSLGESSDQIRQAIHALFLGERANTLEERMAQCKDRFESKERELKRRIDARSAEAQRITDDLKLLEKIRDTRDALAQQLKTKAEESGWKRLPSKFAPEDLAGLQEAVDEVVSEFAECVRQLRWLSVVSIRSLKEEEQRLKTFLAQFTAKQQLADKTADALEKFSDELRHSEKALQILDRLEAYHNEPEALALTDFEAAIEAAQTRLRQLREVKTLSNSIDLAEFANATASLEVVAAQHNAEIGKQRRALSQKRKKIEELQHQFGTVKATVEQIHGLAQRYCELHPDTQDCPLCGAHYEDGLKAQLRTAKLDSAMKDTLRTLTTELSREETKLETLQKSVAALAKIQEATTLMFAERDVSTSSLKVIVQHLTSVDELLHQEKQKCEQLIAKQKRLKLKGFMAAELDELLSTARDQYDLTPTKLKNPAAFQKLVTDQRQRAEVLRKTISETERNQKELDKEVRHLVSKAIGDTDLDEVRIETERRQAVVSDAFATPKACERSVTVSDSDDFSAVRNRLKLFSEAIGRVQEALKRVEEKDARETKLSDTLSELRRELAEAQPRYKRATDALTVLNRLLGSGNKERFLGEVVRQQREKLVSIFRWIHSPKEFQDVELNGEFLLKRDSGTKSKLSQISTGQRTALALSIFLSMNASVGKKTPWLIFDDPVVHVDDINTLSFFDALRDLVLSERRQLFFATANTRIANLFARKFDFLHGGAFKQFVFER